VPLILFAIVGLFFIKPSNYYPLAPAGNPNIPAAIGSATILALWAYLGVEIITVPMDEIKNAKKIVPRAIIITVLVVMAVFLAVATVALGITRYESHVGSGTPLADILQATTQGFVGNIFGLLMAVGGMIAIIGSLNAVILGTPRISFAMAKDKLFPGFFTYVHPKFKTPAIGILAEAIIGITVLLLVADLQSLAGLAVMYTVIPYFLSSLATIQLIRKDNWKSQVVKTRWIPILSVIASIAFFFYFQPTVLLVGAILLLVAIPVYMSRRRFGNRIRKTTPSSAKKEQ
jgi:amino acid transporter